MGAVTAKPGRDGGRGRPRRSRVVALTTIAPAIAITFGSTLRTDVDLGSIERALRDLVAGTIAPEGIALWIR
jgi:hypothetical protein